MLKYLDHGFVQVILFMAAVLVFILAIGFSIHYANVSSCIG